MPSCLERHYCGLYHLHFITASTCRRACLFDSGRFRSHFVQTLGELRWKRRFYDLNVWSEKKYLEKLDTMHANPVRRGLVGSADLWPWSSFRFYCLEDSCLLAKDHLP